MKMIEKVEYPGNPSNSAHLVAILGPVLKVLNVTRISLKFSFSSKVHC